MDPSSETPEADDYDYPTEPIAAASTGSPTSPPPASESSRSANSATVLAAAGAAAIVAALIVTVGITGMLFAQNRAPATAAPATIVQLGQATTATTPAPAVSDSPAPSESAAPPDAPADQSTPADGPAAPVPADSPAATATTTSSRSAAPKPGDPNFTVTADRPTLTDLTNIVDFLVATKASDQAKAANIEGGMSAVVVPKTVYTLGLFRPPLGWNKVTGPLVQNGDTVSATLNSGSAGRPTIRMTIQFKKIGGNWRLAASSMCEGVKTVGLNIYCNR